MFKLKQNKTFENIFINPQDTITISYHDANGTHELSSYTSETKSTINNVKIFTFEHEFDLENGYAVIMGNNNQT